MAAENLANSRRPPFYERHAWLLYAAFFVAVLTIYRYSPVRQLCDSSYCSAQTEVLLRTGSMQLDSLFPGEPPLYTVQRHPNGKLYYIYPPGTVVLSAPLVAVASEFGYACVTPDGSYDRRQEDRQQHLIAAIVAAATAAVLLAVARQWLSWPGAIGVTAGAALGSGLWSTCSRSLWNHTFSVLLISILLLMLARQRRQSTAAALFIFATVAAWLFFVRPSNALVLAPLTIAYALRQPAEARWRHGAVLVGVGLAWLVAFMLWSQYVYGLWLPFYYWLVAGMTGSAPEGLLGLLLSPSRGLLVYEPVLVAVIWLAVRHQRQLPDRGLTLACILTACGFVLAVARWPCWWGGHSFGPRLLTETIPLWFVVAAQALAAHTRATPTTSNGQIPHESDVAPHSTAPQATPAAGWRLRWELGVTAVLLAITIGIHAIGATCPAAGNWNGRLSPPDIGQAPPELWDWQHSQLAAPFEPPPSQIAGGSDTFRR